MEIGKTAFGTHQANVEEVHPTVSVERELRQGGRRRSVRPGALYLPRAAIAGDAAEFPIRILTTKATAPKPAAPGRRSVYGLRLALSEDETGSR